MTNNASQDQSWYLMPWGRYRDKPITEVPRGYLRHIRDNFNLNGFLREVVVAVLDGKALPEPDEVKVDRIVGSYQSPADEQPAN